MLPNTKALLAFAGRFVLAFFLTLPLWFVLTPSYNRLVAFSANSVLPFIEDPPVHTLAAWKHEVLIVRSDTPFTGGLKFQVFKGYLIHSNLILMVALVLAPRLIDWRRRCKILAIALAILFLVHVLYLLIGVKFFQQPELEAFQSPAGRLSVWGVNFYLSMASQLLPVLLWMGLCRTIGGIPGQWPLLRGRNAAGREAKERRASRV